MSVYVSSLVWEHSKHKGAPLLVLLALADIANDNGLAWPGAGEEGWLVAKTRLTDRGVRKIVHETLEVGGDAEVAVTARPGRTNLYQIDVHLLEARRAEHRSRVKARALSEGEQGSNDGSPEPPFRGSPEPPFRGMNESVDDGEKPRSDRGLIYDALVASTYPAGATLTSSEKRKVGIAAVELAKIGATADEVVERVARYRAHATYGGVALTAMSLVAHWGEIAPPVRDPANAPCPACGIGSGMHTSDCPRAGGGSS